MVTVPTDELSDKPRQHHAEGTADEVTMLQSQRLDLVAGNVQQLPLVGRLGGEACQMLLACSISSDIIAGVPFDEAP